MQSLEFQNQTGGDLRESDGPRYQTRRLNQEAPTTWPADLDHSFKWNTEDLTCDCYYMTSSVNSSCHQVSFFVC